MSILDAVLLGVLQGIAEFLPISSSGHLVLAQEVLGISSPGVTFEIMVHAGTLGSILWYYASDITNIARGFFRPSQVLPTQESSWQWGGWILLSMIPAMVVVYALDPSRSLVVIVAQSPHDGPVSSAGHLARN
jgi:undecaprenyl pyrophosphate phosphatase UppP